MRHRRDDDQFVDLVRNAQSPVDDFRRGEDFLVEVVEIVVQSQQEVGKEVESGLDHVTLGRSFVRHVRREHGVDRPQHRYLCDMTATGEGFGDPGHVAGESAVVMPPGILIEHRRRPVALAVSLKCVVESMWVQHIDAENVLPVGYPLHPLHGGVHEDAAERLTDEAITSEVMSGGGCQLDRNVLIGRLAAADDWIEVIDRDDVHVLVVAEGVPLHAHHLA